MDTVTYRESGNKVMVKEFKTSDYKVLKSTTLVSTVQNVSSGPTSMLWNRQLPLTQLLTCLQSLKRPPHLLKQLMLPM